MKLSLHGRGLVVLFLWWSAGWASAQVDIKPTANAGSAGSVPTALEAMPAEPSPAPQIDLGETARPAVKARPATKPAKAAAAKPTAARDGAASAPDTARDTVTEHVEFRERPVPVSVAVGRERMVSFPGPVAVHVPNGLEGKVVVQVIGRTAYITALEPFESTRFPAQDLSVDLRWYPIDVVATPTTPSNAPIEIHPAGTRDETAATNTNTAEAPDMVMLTRFAAHTLYAPRRLTPRTPGVRQVPIVNAPVPGLYRGRRIQTTPVGAWRSENLYVTAVRFTNQEPTPVELDLDEVRGSWLAATAQHGRLGAAGTEADTTAVYLICDRPFEACR